LIRAGISKIRTLFTTLLGTFAQEHKIMKQIKESARTIPVMAETDVLVIGSGPGGLSAAIAAAREGVDTMLVERYGCFGGNITQAQVGTIAWYRREKTKDAGGIGVEFESRAKEMGASQEDPEAEGHAELLEADMFKYVADTLVQEAGIIPILHCFTVNTIMDGATIKGVITESKSGRQAILAKRVIDATGDADVACHAGAPYRKSPKDELMAVTLSFGCSGVDVGRFLEYVKQNPSHLGDWSAETTGKEDNIFSSFIVEPFSKARNAGEIPDDVVLLGYWGGLTEAGEARNINVAHIMGIDSTDVRDLTRAEMEGRRNAVYALTALKNVKNQARFDDSIGIFPEFLDGYGVVIMPTTGRYFQVPYGIILPQEVENLLVAGRCVAGDKISHAATRQMMCCAVTGQGAGIAAAVSLKDNVTCRMVNISRVQKALKKQGVRIE
jgi:ribulose 1,5-bisphosphate synthetase/thiazole synthase